MSEKSNESSALGCFLFLFLVMPAMSLIGGVLGKNKNREGIFTAPTPPDPAAAEERQKHVAAEADAQGSVDVLRIYNAGPTVWRLEDREAGAVCYMASISGASSGGISCLPLSVPK